MSSDDTAVFVVVVLQDSWDLLEGDLGSCSGTGVASGVEGNEVLDIKIERVSPVSVEADQDPVAIPEIPTEHSVSCVSVLSVAHVPYDLCPELPVGYVSLSL
jgi:hypothetical protein